MAWAAVETHADQLGLALSDKALIDGLTNDPTFKDPATGNFSRIALDNIIQQMGSARTASSRYAGATSCASRSPRR